MAEIKTLDFNDIAAEAPSLGDIKEGFNEILDNAKEASITVVSPYHAQRAEIAARDAEAAASVAMILLSLVVLTILVSAFIDLATQWRDKKDDAAEKAEEAAEAIASFLRRS